MSELEAWVNKLGAMTTTEIRELMQAEGVTGLMGNPYACPLAGFLAVKVNDQVIVACNINNGDETESFITPRSMMAFIENFDKGNYPELSM